MSLFSYPSKRRETKKPASGKRTFVPRLEALESRDLLSTFTVINTSSDPSTSGSLPWAVQQANSTPGLNYIKFDIPGSGIHTIDINSVLLLTKQVVIDGTSQPGYNGTPLISVQGSASVSSLFDIDSGSWSTIQGLDMYDYTANAVALTGNTAGNFIQNNWIGFYRDPSTGTVSLNSDLGDQFNGTSGIAILSSDNTIRSNVISGNDNGILVEGPWSPSFAPTPNFISSNYIGTDPSGTTAVGYGNETGILVGQGSGANTIGYSNVISDNALQGIDLLGATGQIIFQNKIGTDVSGNYAIPNGNGITLADNASNNYIGFPQSFTIAWPSGNLISGNRNLAISIGDSVLGSANNNYVMYNIIGLNASQTAAISNGAYGISINSGSQGNLIQSNVIAGASAAGVVLSNATDNSVNQNSIGQNGSYGVELLAGANYNSALQNTFGPNGVGSVYVDPNAVGNYIGYTPQPTPSSFSAQIQQLFGYYPLMVQAVQTGNVNAFVQALENYVTLYAAVEQEIFNFLLRM